ncbi:hypothetical protein V6N11_036169 [Hibiscus sabdariffa]|uniref:Transmembrane protein n=1 Tax=Hibiscus sabdariffa TaxID=183260 RepID=A0ABR2RA34_9ROSI
MMRMEHSHRDRVWFSMVFMFALGLAHFSPLVDATSRPRMLSNFIVDLMAPQMDSPSAGILASASTSTLNKPKPIPPLGPSTRTPKPPPSP